MIARTVVSLAAAAALVTTGCDPFVFDDLQDQTWVDATDKPDGMGSDDYAPALVYAATDETTGARIVVAGDSPAAVGSLRYEADGALDSAGAAVRDFAPELETGVFPERVPIAGSTIAAKPAGSVAIGLPIEAGGAGRVLVAPAKPGTTPQGIFAPPAGVTELGTTVAFADSALGTAGSPDLFASGGNALVLWIDAITASAQPMPHACTLDRERVHGLLGADVSAAVDGEELLVMVGDLQLLGGAASVVHIVSPRIIADGAADDGACLSATATPARAALLTLEAPGGEADFGAVMVSGDFDADSDLDVAIAAPSANKVYVYLGLDADADAPTPIEIAGGSSPVAFGAALSAGDIDGDGADELVVGDPEATVDGQTRAGAAYLLQESAGSFEVRATLHDLEPESNQLFGRAVQVVPFGPSDHIVVVGTNGELFTYFQTPLNGDADVRSR